MSGGINAIAVRESLYSDHFDVLFVMTNHFDQTSIAF